MPRHGQPSVQPRNPPSSSSSSTPKLPAADLTKPLPLKPTGIIILPPSDDNCNDDSPSSSTSNSELDPSASLPDLPGADHRTLQTRSRTTSSTSLNVKFAPLPQLAPRRRRSNAPLGIASRGLMMRRRRAGMPGYDMNGDALPPTPMWTDEEVQRHTAAILAERAGQTPTSTNPRGDGDDDPFMTLGRLMKGAGKQFWRKVQHKKPGEGPGEGEKDKEKEREKDSKEKTSGEENQRPPNGTGNGVVFAERERLVLPTSISGVGGADSEEERGGVWEEAVDDRFLSVSQTETIVEGQSRYSWTAAQLQLKPPSFEDTGSVSDDASGSGREHNLSSEEGSTGESHTSS
ncbi:hypothetical protein C8R46DRAFT_1084321, partial [Mycena filopes]